MDNKKFCVHCGTENSNSAQFCKNCGKEFKENQNINNKDFISEQEFSAFIGKNQKRFLPQFRKFFTGKKVSFSPLVFLLTLLVAPFASGFWFLHRKMYKIGSIILAVGILLQGFMLFETFDVVSRVYNRVIPDAVERYNDSYNDFDDYDDFDEFFGSNEDDNNNYFNQSDYLNEFVKAFKEEFAPYSLINQLINLINLAAAILLGLFAKYIYFKHSVNEIMDLKNSPDYSLEKVKSKGGTNSVPWVITMVCCILIYFGLIFSFAINLFDFFIRY